MVQASPTSLEGPISEVWSIQSNIELIDMTHENFVKTSGCTQIDRASSAATEGTNDQDSWQVASFGFTLAHSLLDVLDQCCLVFIG